MNDVTKCNRVTMISTKKRIEKKEEGLREAKIEKIMICLIREHVVNISNDCSVNGLFT